MKESSTTFFAYTIIFLGIISFLTVFNTQAQIITVKNFASLDLIEDESLVTILSANVTVLASSDGPSLSIKGCYEKKIKTDERGPYKYDYIAKEKTLLVPYTIFSPNSLDINNALDSFYEVEKDLRRDLPFFCKTTTVMVIEMNIEIESTKRNARVLITITKNKNDLFMMTPWGPMTLDQAISVYESR